MKMNNLCLCKTIPISCYILKFVFLTLFFAFCCHATSTITPGEVLRDGQTLTSDGGSIKFGFFSPSNSSLRYVGIWYSNISVESVVWVANRDAPISNENGSVTLGINGSLIAYDGNGGVVWSSNTKTNSNNYTATLHNDGNLEIRGINNVPVPSFTCWQSFDHPTDTYLPGMRVAVNPFLGENRLLFSWKSVNDPSTGNYSMGVDPRAAPQFVIWEGSNRRWRSGYWNGLSFTGVPNMASFYYYGFKLSNADSSGNMYFTYSPQDRSNKFKFKITWDGYEKSYTKGNGSKEWNILQSQPGTECDVFNKCGANGYCNNAKGHSICACFEGFEPKYPDQWRNGTWSGGCVRMTQLKCEIRNNSVIDEDKFLEVDNMKLPDFANLSEAAEEDCGKQCLQNCSCMAHAYVSGIGCMTWSGELSDVEQFTEGGNKLHIRVAASVLAGNKDKLSGPKIAATVVSAVILLCIALLCLWKVKEKVKVPSTKIGNDALTVQLRQANGYSTEFSGSQEIIGESNLANANDLPLFNYNLVASATNFFSVGNKLGQGGFGPVYKGTLPGGQEIAVKKLSRRSSQGMEEFMNEIMLIAKLQHRNLVRILGCCIHEEEKMLLYEYMPNKSLDSFIFDPTRKQQLDWKKRFSIIEGIARGLLYLHRDARCTIIHRDLKASNILLDHEMNPKISDFGMARIFGGNQDQANTNRVVGTYGYMAPEYAMEGFFSERSDVYSFGVLLLEVITGQRTNRFRFSEHLNLVEFAYRLWSEGRTMELVDSSFGSSCPTKKVVRCVHIALLCVQDSAVCRPTMSQVVLWLETDSLALSNPVEPTLAYSSARRFVDIDCQKEVQEIETSNHVTVTMLIGR